MKIFIVSHIKEATSVLREYWEFIAGVFASSLAFASYVRRRMLDPVTRRSELENCEMRIRKHQDKWASELQRDIRELREHFIAHLERMER